MGKGGMKDSKLTRKRGAATLGTDSLSLTSSKRRERNVESSAYGSFSILVVLLFCVVLVCYRCGKVIE